MMPERASRTFICSVLFLDIVEYSRKPVAEQIRLKDRFNALIASAIREIPPADRIILDTGDGVAINFLGDPEDALFVAMSLRDAFAPDLNQPPVVPARIGINLGPVRLVRDLNSQPSIIGDGINVAQRVMAFASTGQILVSRSYYEIVSHMSEAYSRLFSYEGSRTDKHVREHEVYSVGYSTSGEYGQTICQPHTPPRQSRRQRRRVRIDECSSRAIAAASRALARQPLPGLRHGRVFDSDFPARSADKLHESNAAGTAAGAHRVDGEKPCQRTDQESRQRCKNRVTTRYRKPRRRPTRRRHRSEPKRTGR